MKSAKSKKERDFKNSETRNTERALALMQLTVTMTSIASTRASILSKVQSFLTPILGEDKLKPKFKDIFEGYDHNKYNVNVRMENFTDKIKAIQLSVKGLSEGIKHIPSVGDPYIMMNKNKRKKTAASKRRNLQTVDDSKVRCV